MSTAKNPAGGADTRPVPTPQPEPSRTGDTVTVANKLPHTLKLRLHRFEDHDEPVLGGGTRTVKRAVPLGHEVIVRGSGHPVNRAPRHPIIGGYALTPGVSKDFFEEWLRQNRDHDALRNNLIFAADATGHAEGQAKEQAALRTGLEGIDPTNPGARVPGVEPITNRDRDA